MQAAGADRVAASAAGCEGAAPPLPQGAGGATTTGAGRERAPATDARSRGRAGTQAAEIAGDPRPSGPSETE